MALIESGEVAAMNDYGGGERNTEFNYGDHGPLGGAIDYPRIPTLNSSPYYMPNLIAAIVAGIGIVVGCVGPWFLLDTFTAGGLEVHPWGKVGLALGAISAIFMFVQLNWSRTSSSLRWAVPLAWLVLVAAIGSLSIALVQIVNIRSLGDEFRGVTQIGWGLWLMAICSVVLSVTTPIVATQVGRASEAQARTRDDRWAGMWRWVAVGASALVMVVAVYNGYKPTNVSIEGATETQTATQTVVAPPVTVSARSPGESLPANARPCPSNFPDSEFGRSAVGTTITSCPFAEEVRRAYMRQSLRNSMVAIKVSSPVTGQVYSMSCTGSRVVTCTGGKDAIVYLY